MAESKQAPNNTESSKQYALWAAITEWSLLTKFDCYSKIFEYKNMYARVTWLFFFLALAGITAWLVSKNITDYYSHDVNSKIELINERPAPFPAITICDNDPFSSDSAQNLLQSIGVSALGSDINTSTFKEAYTYSKTLTKLAKMYVSSPNFTNEDRQSLASNLLDLIAECYFDNQDCEENFTAFSNWYFSYDFGNCVQINTGRNWTNQRATLLYSVSEGKEYGLSLLMGPLVNRNKYLSSLSTGLVVLLHNQSLAPADHDIINAETGKETNIAIKRTITQKEPSPYSECVDLTAFKSGIYDYMRTLKYAYTQQDCFDLCFQREVIQTCGCYSTEYATLDTSLNACLNLTELTCMEDTNLGFKEAICKAECPLQCLTVEYDHSLSSLVYPNEKAYNVYKSDAARISTLESTYNISLATYADFQKYFLVVNVYYPYLQYTLIKEVPKTTAIDLFSQIGGSIGMFLGFSIFHLVELFEILFLVVYMLVCRRGGGVVEP